MPLPRRDPPRARPPVALVALVAALGLALASPALGRLVGASPAAAGPEPTVAYEGARAIVGLPVDAAGPNTTDPAAACRYERGFVADPAGATLAVDRTTPACPRVSVGGGARTPTRVSLVERYALVGRADGAACADSVDRVRFTHFLDQSGVYLRDTVLDCGGERRTFLLTPGRTHEILLLEDAAQRYVVSGAGLGERYFDFAYLQDGVTLREGRSTAGDFLDTLRVDFKLGVVLLRVTNPNPYPTELLFKRAEGSGRPYPFRQACPSTSYQVCTGTGVVNLECGLADPFRITTRAAACAGIARLDDPRLVDATGRTVAGVTATALLDGWVVGWNVVVDPLAQPEPGTYFLQGLARVPAACAGLGCVSTAGLELRIPLTFGPAGDTVRLPEVVLPEGGTATVFASVPQLRSRTVSARGTYRQAYDCVLYEQRVVEPAVTVNLGERLICPGECVAAPTGETLGCVPGTASLRARNDTIYVATIRYDATDRIILRAIDYACDARTGRWTARLRWSGSRGPYTVDGAPAQGTEATAGPFAGPSARIAIVGGSPCVDTTFVEARTTCVSGLPEAAAASLGLALRQNPSRVLALEIADGRWAVEVADATGRTVARAALGPGRTELPASATWAPGLYVVSLRGAAGRGVLRWVKG